MENSRHGSLPRAQSLPTGSGMAAGVGLVPIQVQGMAGDPVQVCQPTHPSVLQASIQDISRSYSPDVMVDFLSAVNGGWSAWNAVTTCFRQSSGAYTFYRVRRCDNPLPKYGGTCPGSSFESVPCQSGLNF